MAKERILVLRQTLPQVVATVPGSGAVKYRIGKVLFLHLKEGSVAKLRGNGLRIKTRPKEILIAVKFKRGRGYVNKNICKGANPGRGLCFFSSNNQELTLAEGGMPVRELALWTNTGFRMSRQD